MQQQWRNYTDESKKITCEQYLLGGRINMIYAYLFEIAFINKNVVLSQADVAFWYGHLDLD